MAGTNRFGSIVWHGMDRLVKIWFCKATILSCKILQDFLFMEWLVLSRSGPTRLTI